MPTVLHILTRPVDSLAREILTNQRKMDGLQVEVVDLTVRDPDYQALLEKIFSADSVAVW